MKKVLFCCMKMLATVAAICFCGVGSSLAAPEDPNAVLDTIEMQFQFGAYQEAQRAALDLLDRDDLMIDQRREAQVLLSRVYLGLGQIDLAHASFCEVFRLDPEWRPDEISFRSDEIVAFDDALAGCVPETPSEEIDPTDTPLPTTSSKTASGAVLRSLVPGMGQHYKGQTTKGIVFQVAFVGAISVAVMSNSAANSATDEYNAALNDYQTADSEAEREAAYSTMLQKVDEVDSKMSQRDAALIVAGGIWVVNLVDAYLGFPLEESGVELGGVVLPDGQVVVAFKLRK